MAAMDRAHAIYILGHLIRDGNKTRLPLGHKAHNPVLAGAADHAAWNDQPVVTGSVCCKRGADGRGEKPWAP